MIDPQTLDRIRPVVRRLRETKPSIAEILHVRIDAAIKLIEEQAEEITRLKAETRHQAATEWEVVTQDGMSEYREGE